MPGRVVLRTVLSTALVLVAAAALFLALGVLEYRRSMVSLLADQGHVVARSIRATLERNMALGLSLSSLPGADAILSRAVAPQPAVQGALLLAADGELIGRSDPALGPGDLPDGWLSGPSLEAREWRGLLLQAFPIRNSFDQQEGTLVLMLEAGLVGERTRVMTHRLGAGLMVDMVPATLFMGLGLFGLFRRLRTHPPVDPDGFLIRWTGAVATGALVLCLGFGLVRALPAFEETLLPELDRTAGALAIAVGSDIGHALGLGVPFDRLGGMPEYMAGTLALEPRITLLALADATGAVRHAVGLEGEAARAALSAWPAGNAGALPEVDGIRILAQPVRAGGALAGTLFVGADAGFVRGRLVDIMLDMGMAVLVVLLAAMELRRFLVGTLVAAGGRTETGRRQADRLLSFVRLGFFLLVFADSFAHSFLPVYARSLLGADLKGLDAATAVGLPISAFWLAVALSQPLTGLLAHRLPRPLLLGAVAAFCALGLAVCGMADGLWMLLAGRVLGGLAVGAVMILVQDSMLAAVPADHRAQANAGYLSIFFAGTVCGTVTGSLIANHAGPAATLLVAAAFALASVPFLLSMGTLSGPEREGAMMPPVPADGRVLAGLGLLLRNPRFMALLLLAALPARLMIAGFIYYWAPLRLADLGNSPSEAGRAIMAYALLMALTTPFWGRVAGGPGAARRLVLASGGLTAVSAFLALLVPTTPGVVLAIITLGTAQAFGMSCLVTLIFDETAVEQASAGRLLVLAVYRVADRVGLFIGPVVMASLLAQGGEGAGLAGIGLSCLGATLLLAAGLRFLPRRVT
ncbi:MFS transporter [Niveispirillum sp. KHB5.9]|uniref:MFS transporter n=1 Tax=Niveispirillum sp. KHB5.9 TaxID=3400269 RepID=UPI003A89C893